MFAKSTTILQISFSTSCTETQQLFSKVIIIIIIIVYLKNIIKDKTIKKHDNQVNIKCSRGQKGKNISIYNCLCSLHSGVTERGGGRGGSCPRAQQARGRKTA